LIILALITVVAEAIRASSNGSKIPWPMGIAAAFVLLGVPLFLYMASRVSKDRANAAAQNRRRAKAIQDSRGGHEHLIDDHLDYRLLGIEPAFPGSPDIGAGLPPYVSRQVDDLVDDRIGDLRPDAGGVVLIVGQKHCGKTRTAAEAALRNFRGSRLIIPSSAANIVEFVDSEYDISGAVLWLDDLHAIIDQVATATDRAKYVGAIRTMLLTPQTPPTFTIATMLLKRYEHIKNKADENPDSDIRSLLLDLHDPFPMKADLTREERFGARLIDDQLISAAVNSASGFAATLAIPWSLIERREVYLDSNEEVVIDAAIDARLCGHPPDIPVGLLESLAAHLYQERYEGLDIPSTWFGAAFASLVSPSGGPALLFHASHARDTCRVPEALVTFMERNRDAREITDARWEIIANHASPAACAGIMEAGRDAGKSAVAITAAVRGATESAVCAHFAGNLFMDRGQTSRAADYFRRAADRGHVGAARRYGEMLYRDGNRAGAATYLQMAADAGDREAEYYLAMCIDDQDTRISHLRRAANAGVALAQHTYAAYLRSKGDYTSAAIQLRRAADSGLTDSLIALADVYVAAGDDQDALSALREADIRGHAEAAYRLSGLADDAGEKLTYLRRAADGDHPLALVALADRAVDEGEDAEAERLYGKAIEVGHRAARPSLARLLVAQDRKQEAGQLYRAAADEDGDVDAAFAYGALLQEAGDLAGSVRYFEIAAGGGHAEAAYRLSGLADDAGEKLSYLRRAAGGDHPLALVALADRAFDEGDYGEAERLYGRAIEVGYTAARPPLARLLVALDRKQQASDLYRAAADEDGDVEAAFAYAALLQEAGDLAGSVRYFEIAAGGGHAEAAYRLSQLVEDVAQAMDWLRLAADLGHHVAAYDLGMALEGSVEATAYLRRAADGYHAGALAELGRLALQEGTLADAEDLLRRAVKLGNRDACFPLASTLLAQRRGQDAEPFYREAAQNGHPHASNIVGCYLACQGERERALAEFSRARRGGSVRALFNIALLLAEREDFSAAVQMYARANQRSRLDSSLPLGILMAERGYTDASKALLKRAVDNGDHIAMTALANILNSEGDQPGAEALYRRAADAGELGSFKEWAFGPAPRANESDESGTAPPAEDPPGEQRVRPNGT
jgi:TPR repeat protein